VSLSLPRTDADEIASTLPEPSSTTMFPSSDTVVFTKPSSSTPPAASDAPHAQAQTQPNPEHRNDPDNLDDEDFELQAVLQASLMGDNAAPGPSPSTSAAYPSIPGSWLSAEPDASTSPMHLSGAATPIRHTYGAPGEPPSHNPNTEVDPVAASMTRNRMIMERMRREQEIAQRELYADEVARTGRRRNAGQEEEEEMLRRAIAESKAQAQIEGVEQPDDDDDADGEEIELGGDDENLETSQYLAARNSHSASRVYDDDDEGLQRALKASLEAVPEGFTAELPPPPPRMMLPTEVQAPASATNEAEEMDSMDNSSEAEASIASGPSSEQQEAETVSVDELRKRRLARFGG
jgi:ataxin-3